MVTRPSYLFRIDSTNSVSGGNGPSISIPDSRNAVRAGLVSRSSSSPMQPFSPACGLIAAAASFGCSIPSARTASYSSSATRMISALTASFGTSARLTWQVTKTMRSEPEDCIITKLRHSQSSAIRSVCPVNGIPARLTAYLFIGAVTIASTSPASASFVAAVSAS